MKTLFDPAEKDNLINRMKLLREENAPLWGKMTTHQMICHIADQMRVGLGIIPAAPVGNFLSHTLIKYLSLYVLPTPKGKIPTVKEMQSTLPKDFQNDLEEAINVIKIFSEKDNKFNWAPHPYFGKLKKKEWGLLAFSHIDHHLRQFGA